MSSLKSTAVIGAGPSGVMCAIVAAENSGNEITLFDLSEPLLTLLPTGGGRCNLSFQETDVKSLAKSYPRGEKFLYSVFSRFGYLDTIDFFKNIGVLTYVQEDFRVFPESNSASDVRKRLLEKLRKSGVKFKKERVFSVEKIGEKFLLNGQYTFDSCVIASGGRGSGQKIAETLRHKVVQQEQSLVSLCPKSDWHKKLSGISLRAVSLSAFWEGEKIKNLSGDLLFTHESLSGPLIYTLSSYAAFWKFNADSPLRVVFNFTGLQAEDFEKKFLLKLNDNAKRDVLNVLISFVPRSFAVAVMELAGVDLKKKSCDLKKEERISIQRILTACELEIVSKSSKGEVVMAGGVVLDEIDSKTMQSKIVPGLYFCGEVMNIDGLCGGFNLQACWSTGFLAGSNL